MTVDFADMGVWGKMKVGAVRSHVHDFPVIFVWVTGPADLKAYANQEALNSLDEQALIQLPSFHCTDHSKVKVAEYLIKPWQAVWNKINSSENLINWKGKYAEHKLVFQGHSLGGCVAQMLAMTVVKKNEWPAEHVHSFVYNTPRCGNGDYAHYFMNNVQGHRAYWNNDPFQRHPPKLAEDTQAKPVVYKNNYFHAGESMILRESEDGLEAVGTSCAEEEDVKCAVDPGKENFKDHYTFNFDDDPEQFYNPVCPSH
ncbi:unnamed protein product, partial [Mesorhabditis spiculigera]